MGRVRRHRCCTPLLASSLAERKRATHGAAHLLVGVRARSGRRSPPLQGGPQSFLFFPRKKRTMHIARHRGGWRMAPPASDAGFLVKADLGTETRATRKLPNSCSPCMPKTHPRRTPPAPQLPKTAPLPNSSGTVAPEEGRRPNLDQHCDLFATFRRMRARLYQMFDQGWPKSVDLGQSFAESGRIWPASLGQNPAAIFVDLSPNCEVSDRGGSELRQLATPRPLAQYSAASCAPRALHPHIIFPTA